MGGTLSKWLWTGTEIVEREEINDEITSGDAGSTVEGLFLAAWAREGRDLRRRASSADCAGTPFAVEGAGVCWKRSIAPFVDFGRVG